LNGAKKENREGISSANRFALPGSTIGGLRRESEGPAKFPTQKFNRVDFSNFRHRQNSSRTKKDSTQPQDGGNFIVGSERPP